MSYLLVYFPSFFYKFGSRKLKREKVMWAISDWKKIKELQGLYNTSRVQIENTYLLLSQYNTVSTVNIDIYVHIHRYMYINFYYNSIFPAVHLFCICAISP